MQNRLICVAAILMVVAGAAGCGQEAKPERAKNAWITVGGADVSRDDNAYVIAGTAEGSDPDNPGKTRTVPFRIETPC